MKSWNSDFSLIPSHWKLSEFEWKHDLHATRDLYHHVWFRDLLFEISEIIGAADPIQRTPNWKSISPSAFGNPSSFLLCWSSNRPPTTLVPWLKPIHPTQSPPSPAAAISLKTRSMPPSPLPSSPLPSGLSLSSSSLANQVRYGAHLSAEKKGSTPGPASRKNGALKKTNSKVDDSWVISWSHCISKIRPVEPPPWKQAIRGSDSSGKAIFERIRLFLDQKSWLAMRKGTIFWTWRMR